MQPLKGCFGIIKGTMNAGTHYASGDFTINAYADADRAGDPSERRSTTGFLVFLGSIPISYAAKKIGYSSVVIH